MWSRGGDHKSIESALRARRPEASDDLIRGITGRVSASERPRRAWSRVAFASAVSVFVLGTFASFGGLGYASSGASDTYSAVRQVVAVHTLKVSVHKSSAADQYHPAAKPAAFTPPKTSGSQGVQAAVKVQGQTLPFTGFSLLGTFLASLGLIGAGIFLRRRERSSS
jgi:hypothetical protein